MGKSTIIKLLIGLVLLLVLFIGYKLLWTVVKPQVEQKISVIGLTENEKAANGPIPGDIALAMKVWECSQNLPSPGYRRGLNSAEIANGERSGVFPCAPFTGSYTKPNDVFAWRSEDDYQGCTYIINGKPGEIYIVGGDFPPLEGALPAGPYLAKANAASGKELWRTYLDNGNVSGHWIAAANLNIHENGKIIFAWSNNIVQIDPETGLILKHNTIPNGPTPAPDVNFKHLTIAPDGTVILKDQTRPTGSTLQGTMAIVKGTMAGLKQGNSNLVAVDPNTLEILDEIALEEPASSPHIVTMYKDKIAIYFGANVKGYRYFWDPVNKKLSKDDTWEIVAMKEGQTTAACPSIIGEWVAFQTNGAGSEKIASSIVVAHRDDVTRTKVIFPFGDLKEGEWSFCMPKPITDPENNMIYSADMGIGKVAGIKLNQETGDFDLKFVVDNMTTTFQPMIGEKDQRVLILTNMKLNVAKEPIQLALFTSNYKEQITWHEASTGKILAESDYIEPLTLNSLVVPGYGGQFYYPTLSGFMILQPMPKN